ncbi:unnamed protein product [Gongylonema pulchrum]|uniref:Dihydroorotate dehydrogenase (quinone), mitochondrial n=1 Tax=Gongylonema pulchrum TaxID=637853 RepID=A0A3P7MV88_9BILA|nr:unnamed protein product [Gongylonema pulchrum]
MGPEKIVRLNVHLAKHHLLPPFGQSYREYPELRCSTMGIQFNNPLGLAAGFDKDAQAINGLRRSGFGFIEVGTVTPLPQKRDRKSTLKRTETSEGYITQGNFSSAGLGTAHLLVKNTFDRSTDVPLGVNIGRNTEFHRLKTDYGLGVDYFGNFSDYLVVNFGVPNGAEKLSDLEIMSLDKRYGIDGVIISNFTAHRSQENTGTTDGFVSGEPLRDISTDCIPGKVPIIGCGGVSSGQDAYDKIRAGASLIQLYSSLLYQGFPVIGKIKRELVELLNRDGFKNVSEAVGADYTKK